MKMMLALGVGMLAMSSPALSTDVKWADWINVSSDNKTVTGVLPTTTPISITYTNTAVFSFVQTGTGTNYWVEGTPAPYTGGSASYAPSNAPTPSEMVALDLPGTNTITFGEAISGLYLAIISWNGNDAQFNQPFEVVSNGSGAYGQGTLTLTSDPVNSIYGFTQTGEPHAVLYFPGTFSSLTFTDTRAEFWHGVTVGVAMLASEVPGVPEPTTWAMMIAGMAMTGAAMRGRRKATVSFA